MRPEGDVYSYVQDLEKHLQMTLFGGMADSAGAVLLVRGALADGNQVRAVALAKQTQRLAAMTPGDPEVLLITAGGPAGSCSPGSASCPASARSSCAPTLRGGGLAPVTGSRGRCSTAHHSTSAFPSRTSRSARWLAR